MSRGIRLKDSLREQIGLPLVGRVAAGQPILAEEHIEARYQIDPELFKKHRVRRPFEPEGGAYGGKGPLHSGHHHHGGGHTHDHSHDHDHDTAPAAGRPVKLTVVGGTYRPGKRDDTRES
jgi:hypothetical protein